MVNMVESKFATRNNYFTQKLFLELNGYDVDAAVYSLSDQDIHRDGKDIPSIGRLYVEMEDVHEYEFANKYFAGWSHWEKLCASPLVRPYINKWRKELEVKLRTRNLKRMEDLAASGDRQAIKYMADKGWVDQKPAPSKRGRPSKEEKEGALNNELAADKALEEEWQRTLGNQTQLNG